MLLSWNVAVADADSRGRAGAHIRLERALLVAGGNTLAPPTVIVTLALPLVIRVRPLAPVPTGFGPTVEPPIVRLVSVPLLGVRRILSPFVPLTVVPVIAQVPSSMSKRSPALSAVALELLLLTLLPAMVKLVAVTCKLCSSRSP